MTSSNVPLEVPVYIASRGEGVGGVVTVPADPDASVGVILMSGRARDRAHRNGLWVKASRELARHGMYALRIDYPGVGNSTGEPQIFELEDPPAWAVADACTLLLEQTPVARVILVASCFGGRVVLNAAPSIPEVVSVYVAASPVFTRQSTWRTRMRARMNAMRQRAQKVVESSISTRALQRREVGPPVERRVSSEFATSLTAFLQRGTVGFLYGEGDFMTPEILFALDRLPLDESRYELELVPGDLHNFRTLDVQRLTVDRIVAWCSRVADASQPARV